MTTLQRIQALDDFKVQRFFDHLSEALAQAVPADAVTLLDQLPEPAAALPQMQAIKDASPTANFEAPLPDAEAVAFSRQALELLAADPDTEPLVAEKLDSWKDDSMVAGTILAVGGALTFVVLMLTTGFSYSKENGLSISPLGSEFVQPRIDMIKTLLKAIPGLNKMLG